MGTARGAGGAFEYRVNAGFVAERNPEMETAAIGSEGLVFHPTLPVRVPLNDAALLVWACLDGRSTLAEIGVELAAAIGLPLETVTNDVISVVAHFVVQGIAFGSGVPRLALAAPPAPPPPLAAGFPLCEAGPFSVRVGDEVIGVHGNDDALLDRLRAVLAPSLAADPAPARVALVVGPKRGRIPAMCYLYRDDELVCVTPSRGRMLRETLAQLDGLLPPPPGTARVNAHVLVGKPGVGAVLISGAFREMLDLSGARLRRAGWRRARGSVAFVDRSDLHTVITSPRLVLDPEGREAIDAEMPVGPGEGAPEGRHPVGQILLVGSEPDPAKVTRPAQRVAALMPLLRDLGGPVDRRDVEWLARLDDHASTRWIFGTDDSELLDTLDRIAGRGPPAAITLPR